MRILLPLCMIVVAAGLAGCGPHNYLNDNDRLRAENLKLQSEAQQLQSKLDARLGEIQALHHRLAATQPHPLPGAQPPVLSQLVFGKYSGAIDTNSDGRDDEIRVYLQTLDQKGRSLPVAGKAIIQAVAIPTQGKPILLASRVYDPKSFDAAYRAGWTGQHYTLELKLPSPLPKGLDSVTVKVTLIQAGTGITLSQQQAVSIHS